MSNEFSEERFVGRRDEMTRRNLLFASGAAFLGQMPVPEVRKLGPRDDPDADCVLWVVCSSYDEAAHYQPNPHLPTSSDIERIAEGHGFKVMGKLLQVDEPTRILLAKRMPLHQARSLEAQIWDGYDESIWKEFGGVYALLIDGVCVEP